MSLRVVKKILKKVNHYADEMASLSDNQLKDKTKQFRKRVKNGESLDSILPEAFAAMREADKRVLGMFPYDVQVMGGIVLHQGNIAEMKTSTVKPANCGRRSPSLSIPCRTQLPIKAEWSTHKFKAIASMIASF